MPVRLEPPLQQRSVIAKLRPTRPPLQRDCGYWGRPAGRGDAARCHVDLGSRASLSVTTNLPVWPSAGSTVPCPFQLLPCSSVNFHSISLGPEGVSVTGPRVRGVPPTIFLPTNSRIALTEAGWEKSTLASQFSVSPCVERAWAW